MLLSLFPLDLFTLAIVIKSNFKLVSCPYVKAEYCIDIS